MGWIFLAESVESRWLSHPGPDQSPIVKTTDTLNRVFCLTCGPDDFLWLQSGMTCLHCEANTYDMESISFLGDSPARISALRELGAAWQEGDQAYFSKSPDSLANFDQDSFSWRTSQLSLFGGLTEFFWSSLRWGTTVDGRLYQPQKWEPSIFVNDGSYLPTPTASDYGKNVGRRSDGITPSGRDRWSLTVLSRRGELPGHPKGLFNPEWNEQAMGYPVGWTDITGLEMQWFQPKQERRSKDSSV